MKVDIRKITKAAESNHVSVSLRTDYVEACGYEPNSHIHVVYERGKISFVNSTNDIVLSKDAKVDVTRLYMPITQPGNIRVTLNGAYLKECKFKENSEVQAVYDTDTKKIFILGGEIKKLEAVCA